MPHLFQHMEDRGGLQAEEFFVAVLVDLSILPRLRTPSGAPGTFRVKGPVLVPTWSCKDVKNWDWKGGSRTESTKSWIIWPTKWYNYCWTMISVGIRGSCGKWIYFFGVEPLKKQKNKTLRILWGGGPGKKINKTVQEQARTGNIVSLGCVPTVDTTITTTAATAAATPAGLLRRRRLMLLLLLLLLLAIAR